MASSRGAKLSLKFGLVNVPVRLKPLAETARAVPGKGWCPTHGPKLNQQSVCSAGTTDEHVLPNDEKQYAYPHPDRRDELVVVDADTWKALEESRTGTAQIKQLVDPDTIDAAYFDKTYMVDAEAGSETEFDLFAAVLDASHRAAVTTTVLSKQEQTLVFRFSEEFGIVLAHVVKFEQEIRHDDVKAISNAAKERPEVDPRVLEAAQGLLASLEGDFDAGEAQDTLTTARQDVIRALAGGKTYLIPEVEPEEAAPATDLIATLLASVPKAAPAKAKKPAAKRNGKVAA